MEPQQRLLETSAIIVGYAMSRLDARYLDGFGVRSWKSAFQLAGTALNVPPASFKNLRDEFDPFHNNGRRGWHKRPLRVSRQRVLGDFCDLSDDALLEFVRRILRADSVATDEIIGAVIEPRRKVHNVAERLLTGRRAEDLFREHCESIVGVAPTDLVDHRLSALGFDFGVRNEPQRALEVKGLKSMSGTIQFTDREWAEARRRTSDYWLIVVGNLSTSPVFKVWRNPYAALTAKCAYQTTVAAIWRSTITVAT